METKVFILAASDKVKLPSSLKKQMRDKIMPFASFGDRIASYTDAKSGLVPRNNSFAISFVHAIDPLPSEKTYLYISTLSKQDLMIAKLTMEQAFKVFVSTEEFVNETLPILDLMILTTSSKPSVEMDVWIPDEDSKTLSDRLNALAAKLGDFRPWIKKVARIYNQYAPQQLEQAKRIFRVISRDDSLIKSRQEISRIYIAGQIRHKFITENIRRYSSDITQNAPVMIEYV